MVNLIDDLLRQRLHPEPLLQVCRIDFEILHVFASGWILRQALVDNCEDQLLLGGELREGGPLEQREVLIQRQIACLVLE